MATGCNERIRAEIDGRLLQLGGEYLDMFQVCFLDFSVVNRLVHVPPARAANQPRIDDHSRMIFCAMSALLDEIPGLAEQGRQTAGMHEHNPLAGSDDPALTVVE
jgi:hypothetical protein